MRTAVRRFKPGGTLRAMRNCVVALNAQPAGPALSRFWPAARPSRAVPQVVTGAAASA
jgi:hypothetical protein